MSKLGIIGVGGLGGALVAGVLRAGRVAAADLWVYDLSESAIRRAITLGAQPAESAERVAREVDVLVLAVKPKDLLPLLDDLKSTLHAGQVLISVAAGVRLRAMAEHAPLGLRLVRAMPNVGAMLGASMTALVAGAGSDAGLLEARAVFESIGEVALLADEAQLDAATALAASGPAYLLTVLEALADGGVKAGLPREVARRMAAQAMKATALLAQESGQHTAELKDAIASPGGTTIAGLAVLESRGVRGAFLEAVDAAAKRAKELGEK